MSWFSSSEVHLHHLGVVRNEGLWWFPWWGGHEETVEGPLHADEVGEREGSSRDARDSPVKGKGLCSPRRSRCGGSEQSEGEDEAFHGECEIFLDKLQPAKWIMD